MNIPLIPCSGRPYNPCFDLTEIVWMGSSDLNRIPFGPHEGRVPKRNKGHYPPNSIIVGVILDKGIPCYAEITFTNNFGPVQHCTRGERNVIELRHLNSVIHSQDIIIKDAFPLADLPSIIRYLNHIITQLNTIL